MRTLRWTALALTLLAPVEAVADSELRFTITAQIPVFCRISATEMPITLSDGKADIGPVHEICNTQNGYDVTARFSNVDRGVLDVAGMRYRIDQSGVATRGSDHADVRTSAWRVADAHVVTPELPVIMRVTISPR